MTIYPNGVIVWEGQSLLNNDPIVLLVTGLEILSTNRKTGPVAQAYILHKEVSPIQAWQTGADEAICGDCPLKRDICYVDISKAPNNIWRCYKKGNYPHANPHIYHRLRCKRMILRLGAYGDPAAVPFAVWQNLTKHFLSWLGYTHQWRKCDQRLRQYCMASIEEVKDVHEAIQMGWRTYRIAKNGETFKGEILCPHEERDWVQCLTCGLCNGTGGGFSSNVVTPPTGVSAKQNKFNQRFG